MNARASSALAKATINLALPSGYIATSLKLSASSPAWRSRATEKQKRIGWEMAVRIEIIATILDEAHKRQIEEIMDTLEEGPGGLYKRSPY